MTTWWKSVGAANRLMLTVETHKLKEQRSVEQHTLCCSTSNKTAAQTQPKDSLLPFAAHNNNINQNVVTLCEVHSPTAFKLWLETSSNICVDQPSVINHHHHSCTSSCSWLRACAHTHTHTFKIRGKEVPAITIQFWGSLLFRVNQWTVKIYWCTANKGRRETESHALCPVKSILQCSQNKIKTKKN